MTDSHRRAVAPRLVVDVGVYVSAAISGAGAPAELLQADHADHPDRFARRPRPPALADVAWINDPRQDANRTQHLSKIMSRRPSQVSHRRFGYLELGSS